MTIIAPAVYTVGLYTTAADYSYRTGMVSTVGSFAE
jgi:hypothetical protein